MEKLVFFAMIIMVSICDLKYVESQPIIFKWDKKTQSNVNKCAIYLLQYVTYKYKSQTPYICSYILNGQFGFVVGNSITKQVQSQNLDQMKLSITYLTINQTNPLQPQGYVYWDDKLLLSLNATSKNIKNTLTPNVAIVSININVTGLSHTLSVVPTNESNFLIIQNVKLSRINYQDSNYIKNGRFSVPFVQGISLNINQSDGWYGKFKIGKRSILYNLTNNDTQNGWRTPAINKQVAILRGKDAKLIQNIDLQFKNGSLVDYNNNNPKRIIRDNIYKISFNAIVINPTEVYSLQFSFITTTNRTTKSTQITNKLRYYQFYQQIQSSFLTILMQSRGGNVGSGYIFDNFTIQNVKDNVDYSINGDFEDTITLGQSRTMNYIDGWSLPNVPIINAGKFSIRASTNALLLNNRTVVNRISQKVSLSEQTYPRSNTNNFQTSGSIICNLTFYYTYTGPLSYQKYQSSTIYVSLNGYNVDFLNTTQKQSIRSKSLLVNIMQGKNMLMFKQKTTFYSLFNFKKSQFNIINATMINIEDPNSTNLIKNSLFSNINFKQPCNISRKNCVIPFYNQNIVGEWMSGYPLNMTAKYYPTSSNILYTNFTFPAIKTGFIFENKSQMGGFIAQNIEYGKGNQNYYLKQEVMSKFILSFKIYFKNTNFFKEDQNWLGIYWNNKLCYNFYLQDNNKKIAILIEAVEGINNITIVQGPLVSLWNTQNNYTISQFSLQSVVRDSNNNIYLNYNFQANMPSQVQFGWKRNFNQQNSIRNKTYIQSYNYTKQFGIYAIF